jgi:hypothetical protein
MMGLDIHDMENLGEKHVGYGGQEKSTQSQVSLSFLFCFSAAAEVNPQHPNISFFLSATAWV